MAEIDNLSISISASAAAAIAELEKLSSVCGRFGSAARRVKTSADSVEKGFEDVGEGAQKAERNVSSLTDKLSALKSTLMKSLPDFKTFTNQAKSLGSIAFAPVISSFQSLGNVAKSAYTSVTGLFKQISRVAFYRLIRSAIKAITSGLSEGIKNLYHFSETFNGTFYQSMNRIATSANYLKNSLAAMVSPLINAVTPVLEVITDRIVDVFNLINQFIARLTGQSTYTAAKKVASLWDSSTQKAAASTTKTTKDAANKVKNTVKDTADEIKRYTLGFDELNILGRNDNGGSDSGLSGALGGTGNPSSGASGTAGTTDYGSMFETRKISGAVSDFADALRKAFMAQDWESLGTLIGDKINAAINSVNWESIGNKVGTALNGVIKTAYYLLSAIDFINIGVRIAQFLNSAIEEIDFNTLGRLMVKKMTIIPDMIIGFLVRFNWGQAAAKLSDFVIGLFQELSDWLQKTEWTELGEIIVSGIIDFFKNLKYDEIASSFSEYLGSALGAGIALIDGLGKSIGELIAGAFTGIQEYFQGEIDACGGDIWQGILNGIVHAITNIGTWIYNNILKPFADGFNKTLGSGATKIDLLAAGAGILNMLLDGISTVIKGIGAWAQANILQPIIDGIESAKTYFNEKIEECGGNIILGVLSGIIEGLVNIGVWVVTNVFTPIVDGIKSAFGIDSGSAKKMLSTGISIILGIYNGIKDALVGAGTWIKTNVFDKFMEALKNAGDWVIGITAKITTAAKDLWDSVKGGWDKLSNKAVSFVANVSNTSATWLKNVVDWWKNVLGLNDGSEFTEAKINPANVVSTWLNKIKGWWKSILGLNDGSNFKEVKINPANVATTWLNNIVRWWREKLGLNDGSEFKEFRVNVLNKAATWFGNVVKWWRGELGYNDGSSFTAFAVKVRDDAWNWWNTVSNAWNKWTRNLTLTANARVIPYTQWGNFAGAGGGFAEGGSIDAYGHIRRFANGGIIDAIHAYAGGTARAIGSLFLAGEAGPEIVGHVGGRTEVLNRSQLAATMYAAVNAAMAPAAANFANAAAYMYQGASDYGDDDMDMLLQLVRAGSEATERQNELLRQQNEYLRQINAKDFNPEISTAAINRAQARSNRRAGTTIVPLSTQ
jgi:hypothetical protein